MGLYTSPRVVSRLRCTRQLPCRCDLLAFHDRTRLPDALFLSDFFLECVIQHEWNCWMKWAEHCVTPVVLQIGHKLCLWKCRGMLPLLEWGRKLGCILVRVLSQIWPTQLGCRDWLKFISTSAVLKWIELYLSYRPRHPSTYLSLSECFHIFFFFQDQQIRIQQFYLSGEGCRPRQLFIQLIPVFSMQ